jgi:hypothetical protein
MLAMAVVFGTTSASAIASNADPTLGSLLDLSSVSASLTALSLIDTAVASFPMGSAVAVMATCCFTRTSSVRYSCRIQPLLTGLL